MSATQKILIIEANYYTHITSELVKSAESNVRSKGYVAEVVQVPGALEIPPAILFASDSEEHAGFVALGCVIRGETTHYEHVSTEVNRGLMNLALDYGLVIGSGVLTVENEQQALERCKMGGEKDKGLEASNACIALLEMKAKYTLADVA
jgi:6,7-dimethyl-8-ribityllumazine synthase